MECKVVHLVEANVRVRKLLDFITFLGEGSKKISCGELLQVECNCDKLSRMCVAHKLPLGGMISRVLCCMVDCDHLHVIYVEFILFFGTCTSYSRHFVCIVIKS
jgi:hypothetical protein